MICISKTVKNLSYKRSNQTNEIKELDYNYLF